MNRALFLDRDGVIVKLRPEKGPMEIAHKAGEVELIPGISDLIRFARAHGFLVLVISNQPDVARGKCTLEDVQETMREMERQLAQDGASLDRVYYCLHQSYPDRVKVPQYLVDCDCRKPHPGMLLQAAKDFDIDLQNSLMVGDRPSDIEAGEAAKCRTILFHNDRYHPSIFFGRMQESTVRPHFVISELDEIIAILQEQNGKKV